jgi:hypothetical protein
MFTNKIPEGAPLSEDATLDAFLNTEFRSKLLAPLSVGLSENLDAKTDPSGIEYSKRLTPYIVFPDELDEHTAGNAGEKKVEFRDENANIGWKFHLNVAQKDVVAVSDYLKANGYCHKYLSGGEIGDGKVFTVYIGSYALAKKLAGQISTDLQNRLARPEPKSYEIEFAAGVVGRFSGPRSMFDQYGTCGFTLLNDDMKVIKRILSWGSGRELVREYEAVLLSGDFARASQLILDDKTGALESYYRIKKQAEIDAFKALRDEYGDYFYPEYTV